MPCPWIPWEKDRPAFEPSNIRFKILLCSGDQLSSDINRPRKNWSHFRMTIVSAPLQPNQGKAFFEACILRTVKPRMLCTLKPLARQNSFRLPNARSKHLSIALRSPMTEKPQLQNPTDWTHFTTMEICSTLKRPKRFSRKDCSEDPKV